MKFKWKWFLACIGSLVRKYLSERRIRSHNTTFPNSNVYEGDWKDDKMHGEGKMTYANGVVYDGHWRDDKKHGEGTLISIADGIVMMDIGGMANQIEILLQSVWCALRLSLQLAPL
eukprot:scaffold3604_cov83-Skeletonema_dohrnii-CCMP3373.AAC.6